MALTLPFQPFFQLPCCMRRYVPAGVPRRMRHSTVHREYETPSRDQTYEVSQSWSSRTSPHDEPT